ncbi:hypothetical protein GF386_05980 [Candidatus Pacearchaeota archaeon]|nr:hypothetical protein [Candidatus Pacearchaeota archaeon]MBD3283642.1 hypothetical protein [Candidatus Pacearchaeota archaeon]
MNYNTKKLTKLNDREFAEDIKNYIKSSHNFYEIKIPELKVLAKRLHEEYKIKDFYKVFNRLWKKCHEGERALAIRTLQLYKKEFNIETWKFLKNKLKDMKSCDQIDFVSERIVGEILLNEKELEKELEKISRSDNFWLKRIAIVSTIPMIKTGDFRIAIRLLERHINSEKNQIQEATGRIINEIGKKNKNLAKKIILKHVHMPNTTFEFATENLKELRKLRKIKKLKNNKSFWKW